MMSNYTSTVPYVTVVVGAQTPRPAAAPALQAISLSQAIDDYLEFRYDLAPKTRKIYREHLARMSTTLDNPDVHAITPHQIAKFMGSLVKQNGGEYKPGYKHQAYRTLQAFFNHAIKVRWIERDRNPIENVAKPSNPTGPKPRMTIDQLKRLINTVDATRGHRCVERNRAILVTMIDTGLRRNEVTGLELNQIDFEAASARVFDHKTNQYRFIPLSAYCLEAITDYLPHRQAAAPTNRLFLTATGEEMDPENINSIIKALKPRLDFPIHPHLLRHTFANLYLRKGDIRYLQVILGHSDIRTTAAFYTAPEFDEIQAQYNLASPSAQLGLKKPVTEVNQ
jgi:integrase/recombinase XerC